MVNSVWNHRFALIPVVLKSLNLLRGPVLLLPHGELEPGALALKSGKKRLAGPLFRAVYRHGVSIFGATSYAEANNIATWLPTRRVVTTLNNLPDVIPWGEPIAPSPHLRALFLSRIDPKKGLLPLLLGLRLASRAIHLSIVGPPEDLRYWRQCQEAIAQLPEHVTVTHTGLAQRDEIPPILWNSDCMLLLTAGENYGHVIAEALQAGCPVITTPTTPWTDVIRDGGGDIVGDANVPEQVAAVVDRWAAKTPEELTAARHRAKGAFHAFSDSAGPNIVGLALAALSAHE
jgi:glycosyltransferase involved in cell wall biosynthesis